jgi:general stress protein 26
MSIRRIVMALTAAGVLVSPVHPVARAQAQKPLPDRATIVKAAREIMEKAHYCTLITIGDGGQPQARIVDPFAPETDFTIWMATNRVTRKVAEIRKNPRVTLACFDHATMDQVTVLGRAAIVDAPADKAKWWKPAWAKLYKDQNRGDDYLLLRMTADRLEVASAARGLPNDPVTWKPVVLDLRSGRETGIRRRCTGRPGTQKTKRNGLRRLPRSFTA